MLRQEADILPGNTFSPVYPFLGCVVNLNVATVAHRDQKDKALCLVLPLGDFTGGELCLYEPGFVVQIQSGDLFVFASCDITHFNMHYIGSRASIVLHTDKEMIRWRQDRNGWASNVAME